MQTVTAHQPNSSDGTSMTRRLPIFLTLILLMAGFTFGCATRRPFPDKPVPVEESTAYQLARLSLYQGMPKKELRRVIRRRPLLRGSGPDTIELIYVFRAAPPRETAEPEHGNSYLYVFLDRTSERVVRWE